MARPTAGPRHGKQLAWKADLFGLRRKPEVLTAAAWFGRAGLACLAAVLAGVLLFLVDVVVSGPAVWSWAE